MRNTSHPRSSELLESRLHLSVSTPHLGRPFLTGQPIRAVDFDDGGQDVSYHITTPKPAHPLYRNSPASIIRQGHQFALTHIVPGEWFNYTIKVPSTGLYAVAVNVRGAQNSSETFHLELDGTTVSDHLAIPTGLAPAQEYDMDFTKGKHILRVVFDPASAGQSAPAIGPFSSLLLYPSPFDSSFGSDGVVSNLLPSSTGKAQSAAIQSDNKILISASGGDTDYLLRLNPNGSLDTSFGSGGIVETPVYGPLALEPNGDIILAGLADPADKNSNYIVTRYHPDGSLNTDFADAGTLTGPQYGSRIGMGVLSNGDIVVAASQGSYRNTYIQARAYTPDGNQDNNFYPYYTFAGGLDSTILDLQVLPGDQTLVASQRIVQNSSTSTSEQDDAFLETDTIDSHGNILSRHNAKAGTGTSCCPETDEYIAAASIRPDGKYADATYSVFADQRGRPVTMLLGKKSTFQVIDPDGSTVGAADFSYGVTAVSKYAYTITPFASPDIASLALQGDGKLLVLGSSNGAFSVARLKTPNGPEQYAFAPPSTTPLTIQAEDFDMGGQGISYHDSELANQGSLYRASGVDIGDNGEDGLAVGWTAPGEWLDYTVNIPKTGNYKLSVRAASDGAGGALHFTTGHASTGSIKVPDTGSWTTWKSLSGKTLHLAKGAHTFRLWLDTAGPTGSIGNLDSFTLRAV
jgi:uncharacterized delta-60 repeat protein